MSNTFIGGKLRFKNNKASVATIKIKEVIASSAKAKHLSTVDSECLQDIKEIVCLTNPKTLDRIYGASKENSLVKNSEFILSSQLTPAERGLQEKRLKRLPNQLKKELTDNSKIDPNEKFKQLLDKQPTHYDIPKVGSG